MIAKIPAKVLAMTGNMRGGAGGFAKRADIKEHKLPIDLMNGFLDDSRHRVWIAGGLDHQGGFVRVLEEAPVNHRLRRLVHELVLGVFCNPDHGVHTPPDLHMTADRVFAGPITIGQCLIDNDHRWCAAVVIAGEVPASVIGIPIREKYPAVTSARRTSCDSCSLGT